MLPQYSILARKVRNTYTRWSLSKARRWIVSSSGMDGLMHYLLSISRHRWPAALGAAQKEQIVHRDIKPTNLMLNLTEEGVARVKVIDFGLARSTSGSESQAGLSIPGALAGTALSCQSGAVLGR